MVVHGRNLRARDAMFMFLRTLGLDPIEWEQAVRETGIASPHNLDAVRAAMDVGQAVVVLLTAEDRAGVLPELADGGDDEDVVLRGQPRQNVILEAGLAMGVDRSRTILVELGNIRRASDVEGLNAVRLSNATPTRNALRSRLQGAGCLVSEGASDWMRPESGGDFEAAVIFWRPLRVDEGPRTRTGEPPGHGPDLHAGRLFLGGLEAGAAVSEMTRLDEIEASMGEAKAWAKQGPEYRKRGRTSAATQMRKLGLLLAEMTEDAETIAQTKRIVEIFDSF
jgi:predicted nucleotide-binding protein with TIR-like domain